MIIQVTHLRLDDTRMIEIGFLYSNLSTLLFREILPVPHNNVPSLEVHIP